MSHVAAAAQAALFTKNTAQNQQSAIQPASGNVGNIRVLANASTKPGLEGESANDQATN